MNLLNTERRPEHASFESRTKTSKLPFANVHTFSDTDGIQHGTHDFLKQLTLDDIRALKTCLDSQLPWCSCMKEDAVFTSNFLRV